MINRLFTKIGLEHFALGLQLPILVALPLSRGVPLTQIGILEAILAVALFCFEVPSGYVADKLGRKFAMIISSISFAISYCLFALAQDFPAFILPYLLMGIGFAMLSGADEAYLFDSLKTENREKGYRLWFGRLTVIDEISTIIGLIISSLIARWVETTWVFLIAALAMLITSVYTLVFLKEAKPQEFDTRNSIQPSAPNPISLAKRAVHFLQKHAAFAIVLLVFALQDQSGRLLWQPRLLDLGYLISDLGFILAGLKIFSIIGSWLSGNIKHKVGRLHFFCIGIIAMMAFVMIGLGNAYVAIAGLGLYYMMENAFRIFRSEYLNERIDSKYRATLLSMNSFSSQIFASIFVVALGSVADYRLQYAFFLLIGLKLIAAIVSLGLPIMKEKK